MRKKVWKKILAVVLVLCLLAGTGLGYLAAIHQPEAKIVDRLTATEGSSGGSGDTEVDPPQTEAPQANLSYNVSTFTQEQSEAMHDAIEKLETTQTGIQMVVQQGSSFDDLTVGDIFFLEGDETSPFGGSYIGKISSAVVGDGTTSYTLETPMIDEVFDKLAFSHEDVLSAENVTSVDCVPGVTWVGNPDATPAQSGYSLSKLSSVTPLGSESGTTKDLMFEVEVDLLELIKGGKDEGETCSYMAAQTRKVYTTTSGHCYHEKNCKYLWNGKTETTLHLAVKDGLKPCAVCKAPNMEDDEGVLVSKPEIKLTGKIGLDELKYSVACDWDILSGEGIEDLWLNLDGKFLAELAVEANHALELGGRKTQMSFLNDHIQLEGLRERLFPLVAVRLGAFIQPVVGNEQLRAVTSTMPLSLVVVIYADVQGQISANVKAYINYEKEFHYNKTLFRDGEYVNETEATSDPGQVNYGVEFEAKGDVDANVGCGVDLYIFNLKLAQLDLVQFGFEAEGNFKLQYSNKVADEEEPFSEAEYYVRLYLKMLQLKLCFKAKLELFPWLSSSLGAEFDYVVLDLTLKDWGAKSPTKYNSNTMSSTNVTAQDGDYIYYKDLDGTLVREKDGYREVLYSQPFYTICGIDDSYIYVTEHVTGSKYSVRRISKTDDTSKIIIDEMSVCMAFDEKNIYYQDGFDNYAVRCLNRQTLENTVFVRHSDPVVYLTPQGDGFHMVTGYVSILGASCTYHHLDKNGQIETSYGSDPAVSNLLLTEFDDYYVSRAMAQRGILRDSCSDYYWLSKDKSTSIRVDHRVGWNSTGAGIFTTDRTEEDYDLYNILLYRAKDGACEKIATVNSAYAFFTMTQGPQGEWYFFDQTKEELILYMMDADFGNLREIKRLDLEQYPCNLNECSVVLMENRLYFYSLPNTWESEVLYRYDII